MGNICCNSEENFLFPLEDMIFDLLNNLLIRNLSEEQMRAKLKSFFLNYNKDKNIKEELLSIIMDTNNDNPNIAFQEKFIKKLFEKIGDLCTKNIMIFIYPLLCNNIYLTPSIFFMLIKEKLGNEFTFAQLEKILIPLIELFTHDLNFVLYESLEVLNEKQNLNKINETSFSLSNIEKYISTIMEKEKFIEAGLWNEIASFEIVSHIVKHLGINNFSEIRKNLLNNL